MDHENKDFIRRLNNAFDNGSMADVARRLKIPHATVRNYYQGRLPAPEVLIKIANETGVSLNWLLIGTGDKYAGQVSPMSLGKFIEEKIVEMIDQKFASLGKADPAAGNSGAFDLERAVLTLSDPQIIMGEWFRHEGRECPSDFGVVFFRGWESFSHHEKIDALVDAKNVLDRSLKQIS
ncbi:hypothetical protein BH10ACI3_BH10ACI3_10150 [soil metagenome]